MSVVVVVVVVVSTKIAKSQDLGISEGCKHSQIVKVGEKLASMCVKVLRSAYERVEIVLFDRPRLLTVPSTALCINRLRMLKLCLGKGRQATNFIWQKLKWPAARAGYVLYSALVNFLVC